LRLFFISLSSHLVPLVLFVIAANAMSVIRARGSLTIDTVG